MENKITEKDEKVRIKKNCKGYLAFQAQNVLHQEMLLLSIANFFAIVLQCNSIFRIAL